MLDISLGSLRRRGVSGHHIVYVCVNAEDTCGIFAYEEATVRDLIRESADSAQGDLPLYRCFGMDGRKVDALLSVISMSPPTDEEMEDHRKRMTAHPDPSKEKPREDMTRLRKNGEREGGEHAQV